MNCTKKVCPEGLSVCCGACIRKAVGACDGVCDRATKPDACVNYVDQTEKRAIRRAEKKRDRRMLIWMVILFVIILAILGAGIYQSCKNAEYIATIESGLPVAADQSAMSSKEDKSNTTYSISDPGVSCNDR